MRKRLPSFFFILSFFLIFSACTITKTQIIGGGGKQIFSSPLVVLEKIDRDNQFKDGVKAIARIEVNTPEGRYPLKAALVLKRPSSFRLETIPVIGPADLFLTVHENVLKVFVPQNGKFYIGKATTRNLAHFIPVPATALSIEDMTSILLGMHPEIRGKTITLDGSSEGSLYRIDILSENRKIQSLWVEPEEDRLVRVDLFADNNSRLFSARFIGRGRVENMTMPENVTIAYGDNDKPAIIIRYVDIGPAKGIDATIFDLKPPPGVIPISMDR
ncbi:MAG: hypothetical protein L7F78_08420 [Syntrophales bacterium LBB04]|nr:hypothetical protein [Syntrophales bacterium LBB04]